MRTPNFLLVLALAGLAWPAAAQDVHPGKPARIGYEGGLVNGAQHGKGAFAFTNGARYQSDMIVAQLQSKGVVTYSEGSRYEGDLVDGKPHGKGVLTYSDGNRLSGNWANGKWRPTEQLQHEAPPSAESPARQMVVTPQQVQPNSTASQAAGATGTPAIEAAGRQTASPPLQDTGPTAPVPANTLLVQLPKGSRIAVKRSISIDERFSEWHRKILYGKATGPMARSKKDIGPGMVLPIDSVLSKSIRFAGDPWFIYFEDEAPKTVDDFNRRLGSYFQIIYDNPNYDPYPGMDKGTVTDILMTKITAALKTNDYAKALPDFARLGKLGVSLPESFYFYYTESLDKAGKKAEARVHAEDYLKRYGKQGRYYAQVIEIMGRQ